MATVIARREVGPSTCSNGSRGLGGDPRWDVSWKSENPPRGLPTEFLEEGTCNWNKVGERVEVIRVTKNGRTKVYQDVIHAGRESLELAAWMFAIVTVFGVPLAWLQFGLTRWWRRLRAETRTENPRSV
ncbi:hypothetical protein [Aeromicrobium choanae]|nr:hypothetical protein [Aeromicrobium choanae]